MRSHNKDMKPSQDAYKPKPCPLSPNPNRDPHITNLKFHTKVDSPEITKACCHRFLPTLYASRLATCGVRIYGLFRAQEAKKQSEVVCCFCRRSPGRTSSFECLPKTASLRNDVALSAICGQLATLPKEGEPAVQGLGFRA